MPWQRPSREMDATLWYPGTSCDHFVDQQSSVKIADQGLMAEDLRSEVTLVLITVFIYGPSETDRMYYHKDTENHITELLLPTNVSITLDASCFC
jgi:hypothetical protein